MGETPLDFSETTSDCCIKLPVLAETVFTSNYFNDITAPLFFWGPGFSTADLKLQKYTSGAWADTATLNVSTWGTAYTYGFFTNIYSEKAIGYKLQWKLVLAAFGEGNYRIKSTGTRLIGGALISKYSFEFCLSEYTANRADETVRFEWYLNGTIGNPEKDSTKRDYGTLNWYNQFRLPDSKFGWDSSPFEHEFVKYQNGKKTWLKDSQVEEYLLKIGRMDNSIHRYIKIDVLQADEINITDYNIFNANRHQSREVIHIGSYEPNWDTGSLLADVEVKFAQRYQNHIHKRN